MKYSGNTPADFFNWYRARNESLVLATITSTLGSTYRKAGAQMLIAGDGSISGLLSGGCLESDLAAHAATVLDSGQPRLVEYDTRTSDDLIWGMGLGCEGAMQILLTRLASDNDYEPFAHVQRCRDAHRDGSFALVVDSNNARFKVGDAFRDDAANLPVPVTKLLVKRTDSSGLTGAPRTMAPAASAIVAENATFLVVPIDLPVRLLVLGAGPDAIPLIEIAGLMGWHVTVLDHRPAYAVAERFARARKVMSQAASLLPVFLAGQHFDAAVVMSHHLTSDETYLAALADSDIRYVGLLGPAPRRIRLLSDIGERAERLAPRLYGPVGLDIGAHSPETIALAIASEIQSVLADRQGSSFSASVRGGSKSADVREGS